MTKLNANLLAICMYIDRGVKEGDTWTPEQADQVYEECKRKAEEEIRRRQARTAR